MNIFSISFDALDAGHFSMALTTIVVLTTIFACVLAWKRLAKNYIYVAMLVVVLNIVAAGSILGLIFNISYLSTKPIHVYLLTNNADLSELDNLNPSEAEVVWLKLNDQLAMNAATNKTTVDAQELQLKELDHIDSVSQIPLYYPLVSELVLLGDGLSPSQWQELNNAYANHTNNTAKQPFKEPSLNLPFIVQAGYTPIFGLSNIQWPKQLNVGEFAEVSGRLKGPQANAFSDDESTQNNIYTLTLLDPFGNEIASQRLRENEDFSFKFQSTVKGQWLYTLALKRGLQSTLEINEVINIQVLDAAPMKVLIKQSAPSFETRQLQNLLNEQGSKVLSLTKISKNKEIAQFTNLDTREKELSQTPFSAQALAYFDIFITDQRAINQLTPVQVDALSTAIKEGLGLLVLMDAQQVDNWNSQKISWLNRISLNEKLLPPSSQQSTFLRWDFQSIETPINAISARLVTAANTSSKVLVSEQNDEALAVTANYGLGQVSGSLFSSSYAFKTQGKPELHSHYWQWMIQNIARSNGMMHWQHSASDLPVFAGEQQTSCLVNTNMEPLIEYQQGIQATRLNASLQILDAEKACVTYWPTTRGWFSLFAKAPETPQVSKASYVYALNQWPAWQQDIKRAATSKVIAHQKEYVATINEREIEVSKYWFWAFLITSLSALWLEQRLNRH
jgi:hypothetical protein